MTWFLIVVFLGTDGGLYIKDGWYPRQQLNQQVCEKRAMAVINFLTSITEEGRFTVECAKIGRGLKI